MTAPIMQQANAVLNAMDEAVFIYLTWEAEQAEKDIKTHVEEKLTAYGWEQEKIDYLCDQFNI